MLPFSEGIVIEETLLVFGTLFPIINPFSTSFIFNKLTAKYSVAEKRNLAKRSCVTAFAVLAFFLFLGEIILSFFNITLYAFRVAGGLYLGKIGFEMLGKNLRKDPSHYDDTPEDIAIIPLAIPLLSGPGAITSVLVMSNLYSRLSIVIAIFIILVLSYVMFNISKKLDKVLGRTGTNVLERLLGLLVLVIAVQFIFNGINEFIGTWYFS